MRVEIINNIMFVSGKSHRYINETKLMTVGKVKLDPNRIVMDENTIERMKHMKYLGNWLDVANNSYMKNLCFGRF